MQQEINMKNSAEKEVKPVPKNRFQEFATAIKLLEEAKCEITKLEKRNNDLADALNELYEWATDADRRQNVESPAGEVKSRKDSSAIDNSMKGDISINVRKSLAEYFCPSQEIDTLEKENKSLKEQIDILESKSDIHKEVVVLKKKILGLESENECKEQTVIRITKELTDYKQLVDTSDHEKEAEILKLKQILREKENYNGLEKMRKTLNEEAEILKKRLVETAEMCKKYTNIESTNKLKETDSSSKPHAAVVMYGNTSHVLPNDVGILQEQLKDVLDKNYRWQTYNTSREDYVRNLLQKYNDLSKRLQSSQTHIANMRSNPDQLASEQRKYFDGLLIQARQELDKSRVEATNISSELETARKRLNEETEKLQKEVDYWRERYEEQREANGKLSAECESERRRSNNSMAENKDKKTQIQFLQRQVNLYSEDFRAERKEKEELKREVNSLKREAMEVKLKHSFSKKTLGRHISNSNHDAVEEKKFELYDDTFCYTSSSNENAYNVSSPPKLMKSSEKVTTRPPRRPAPVTPLSSRKCKSEQVVSNRVNTERQARKRENDRVKKRYPFLTENEAKPQSSRVVKEKPVRIKRPTLESELSREQIECPSCGKQYNINQHMLLLEHIDVCE